MTLDYYITDFENKVVADWETPTQINFYNLIGKSFSNSFQAQFSYTLSNSIDLLFAYKNTVAKTDYIAHGRLKNPLTPSDRFFFNVAYNGQLMTKEKIGSMILLLTTLVNKDYLQLKQIPLSINYQKFQKD